MIVNLLSDKHFLYEVQRNTKQLLESEVKVKQNESVTPDLTQKTTPVILKQKVEGKS